MNRPPKEGIIYELGRERVTILLVGESFRDTLKSHFIILLAYNKERISGESWQAM